MSATYYRIIDTTEDRIVAQGISSLEEVDMTMSFYLKDYPGHDFLVESYTVSAVKPGFGRDPDLH